MDGGMNGFQWPVRMFGPGPGGESLGQFHANMREVCGALQDEPECTIAELAETLGMPEDTVNRAVLQLLNDRRILATFGRHRVQTFRVNHDWRPPVSTDSPTLFPSLE
jgi:hypothetical protein